MIISIVIICISMYTYMYIYIYTYEYLLAACAFKCHMLRTVRHLRQCSAIGNIIRSTLYILQRGVQWKQGVAILMVLYTILLYN